MSGGSAKSSANATARIAKQKSGIRFSDMPGARSLKIVVMKLIAAAVEARPFRISPSAKTSTLRPGSYGFSASGT